MKEYKAAIFDLDGTLLNTDLYIVVNYVRLFERYAPTRMPTLEEMVYFSGPPLTDVFKKYLPEFDPEMLKRDFISWAIDNSNRLSFLYPKEKESLDSLRKHGIRLGLVTNKGIKACNANLSYFGLLDYFDSVYTLERCLVPKPDPWPLLMCAKDLKIPVSETLYIGDDKSDIQAARGAGMDVGLVLFGLKTGQDILPPDYRFRSYGEIERILTKNGSGEI